MIARPNNIQTICDLFIEKSPKSVLDCGCGFGMYGFLARTYSLWQELDLEKYKNWKSLCKVDAIEIFESWITPIQKDIYDNIFIGDMAKVIDEVGDYDMIIMADSLEHLTLEEGLILIDKARKKTKTLVISTPDYWFKGDARAGNEHEQHKSFWRDDFFPDTPKIIKNGKQKVVIYER